MPELLDYSALRRMQRRDNLLLLIALIFWLSFVAYNAMGVYNDLPLSGPMEILPDPGAAATANGAPPKPEEPSGPPQWGRDLPGAVWGKRYQPSTISYRVPARERAL